LYGLQGCADSSDAPNAALRGVLTALTVKITGSTGSLTGQGICMALYGLQNCSDSVEVRLVLAALAEKVDWTWHCRREIRSALLWLRLCAKNPDLAAVTKQQFDRQDVLSVPDTASVLDDTPLVPTDDDDDADDTPLVPADDHDDDDDGKPLVPVDDDGSDVEAFLERWHQLRCAGLSTVPDGDWLCDSCAPPRRNPKRFWVG